MTQVLGDDGICTYGRARVCGEGPSPAPGPRGRAPPRAYWERGTGCAHNGAPPDPGVRMPLIESTSWEPGRVEIPSCRSAPSLSSRHSASSSVLPASSQERPRRYASVLGERRRTPPWSQTRSGVPASPASAPSRRTIEGPRRVRGGRERIGARTRTYLSREAGRCALALAAGCVA
jgi:hypothetical protein